MRRSYKPSEPSAAVAFNVQMADASAATETDEEPSSMTETGDEALLLICRENVSVSLPVLNTRTSNEVSTPGSSNVGPLGPCRTNAI